MFEIFIISFQERIKARGRLKTLGLRKLGEPAMQRRKTHDSDKDIMYCKITT